MFPELDLIRVQRLSLRTNNDQGSLTKERDRIDTGGTDESDGVDNDSN